MLKDFKEVILRRDLISLDLSGEASACEIYHPKVTRRKFTHEGTVGTIAYTMRANAHCGPGVRNSHIKVQVVGGNVQFGSIALVNAPKAVGPTSSCTAVKCRAEVSGSVSASVSCPGYMTGYVESIVRVSWTTRSGKEREKKEHFQNSFWMNNDEC